MSTGYNLVSYNFVDLRKLLGSFVITGQGWNALRKIGISFSSNSPCDKPVLRVEKKIKQSDIDVPYFKETAYAV